MKEESDPESISETRRAFRVSYGKREFRSLGSCDGADHSRLVDGRGNWSVI